VLTENNILIFDFQNMKLVQEIKISNDDFTGNLTCMLPLLDAFIVAGTNRRFEIFERKNNENYLFSLKGTSDFDKDQNFNYLTLACQNTSNEKFIFATTSNNSLISINIRDSSDAFLNNISAYTFLISKFHSDSIEGLDVCINKPYVISCSKDKSLRVWDYKKKISVIDYFYEDGEMHSVAFHPSGMHAIVSFDEKIKPINIFYDEILSMLPQGSGISAKKAKDVNIIIKK
jgi:WD40 repeat protein